MKNEPRSPRLLLCEGPDDVEFFKAFIEIRNLPKFRVRHTGTKENPKGGNTRFVPALKAWYEFSRFSQVLIVSDNDDDPQRSFANVREQIKRHFGFAPDRPREMKQGPPKVSILMLPWDDEPGNLESLCIEAAKSADGRAAGAVDQFAAQVGIDRWTSECRRNEMWLRANLAARCERHPFVSLRDAFSDNKYRRLIPLSDSSFKRIHDAIVDFSA